MHGHISSSLEVLLSVFASSSSCLKSNTHPIALLIHPSAGHLCPTLLFQEDPDQQVTDKIRVLLGQWWRLLIVPTGTLAASMAVPRYGSYWGGDSFVICKRCPDFLWTLTLR